MMLGADIHEGVPEPRQMRAQRSTKGFSLVEMMVTTLILTLVATLMATGIPAAIDTYRKMVRTSNAQVALSTTIEVVRSELGLATDIEVVDNKIYYYNAGTGYWCSIGDHPYADDGTFTIRGLVKQVYKGAPTATVTVDKLEPYNTGEPLLANEAITDELEVKFADAVVVRPDKGEIFIKLYVQDRAGNHLAQVGESDGYPDGGYRILTRFVA